MQINELLDRLRTRKNLADAFFDLAQRFPDRDAYSQASINSDGNRTWISESYASVAAKVAKVARYLRSLGVTKGSRVAIVSYTRPEWLIADLAIQAAAGVSTSIYQSVNRDETGYILFDSGAEVVFAENEEQVAKLLSLQESTCPIAATEDRAATTVQIKFKQIITFENVAASSGIIHIDEILTNANISAEVPESVFEQSQADLASLVYTSGTTGPPKGVMQTHGNHLANVWQSGRSGIFAPEGDMFLFLPLAHSFARLIGYIGFLTPTQIKFPAVADRKSSVLNATSVLRDLREAGANVVPTVPRILEKMVSGLQHKASLPGIGGTLLALTLSVAQQRYEAIKNRKAISAKTTLVFILTSALRKKIKLGLFGKGFTHVVSGGAKLPLQVAEFFAALGVDIYQGYGLTETVVATNVNRIGKNKIGSVGPCFEEIECKITEEGEILFRGPNIARGYWNRPSATSAAWDQAGWFHTGDLGELDSEGYLFITGRKKELIVTAGGKKVAPGPIEEKLVASPYISHAIVVGEGQPFCSVLISPEAPNLRAWAESQKIPYDLTQPIILNLIESEIKAVNATLSKFETIKRFKIINDEFSVENGFLTPTFKLKRKLVVDRYKDLIDEIYNSSSSD